MISRRHEAVRSLPWDASSADELPHEFVKVRHCSLTIGTEMAVSHKMHFRRGGSQTLPLQPYSCLLMSQSNFPSLRTLTAPKQSSE